MNEKPLTDTDRQLVIIGAGTSHIKELVKKAQDEGNKVLIVSDSIAENITPEKIEDMRRSLIENNLLDGDELLNGLPEPSYPDEIVMTKEELRGKELLFGGPLVSTFMPDPMLLTRQMRDFKDLLYPGMTRKQRNAPPAQPVRTEPKINRNAPCPCGSGKKYKKCCGLNNN